MHRGTQAPAHPTKLLPRALHISVPPTYLPAGQSMQELAVLLPSLSEYFPTAHSTQLLDPAAEYLPERQVAQ